MKTLVIQSYRTTHVPGWIDACMQSVRAWAQAKAFAYECVDDRFFDYAPDWFRERCGKHFYPVTDIARLYLMKDRLTGEYERVVWVDADVVVFDPDRFSVKAPAGYAFCHEVMLGANPDGTAKFSGPSINNAVMVMQRGHAMLDYYIFAAEAIVRHTPKEKFSRTMIGPRFLVALSQAMPLARLTHIGLFTHQLMDALANNKTALIRAYRNRFGHPIAGANLCHFIRSTGTPQEIAALDMSYLKVVDGLMATRGSQLNQYAAPINKHQHQVVLSNPSV